jgi:hypothetical protein
MPNSDLVEQSKIETVLFEKISTRYPTRHIRVLVVLEGLIWPLRTHLIRQ